MTDGLIYDLACHYCGDDEVRLHWPVDRKTSWQVLACKVCIDELTTGVVRLPSPIHTCGNNTPLVLRSERQYHGGSVND